MSDYGDDILEESDYESDFIDEDYDDEEYNKNEGEFSKKEKVDEEDDDDEDDEEEDEDLEEEVIVVEENEYNNLSNRIPKLRLVPMSKRKSSNRMTDYEYAAVVGHIAKLIADEKLDVIKFIKSGKLNLHDEVLNCAEEVIETNPDNILETITMVRSFNNEMEHWLLSELVTPKKLMSLNNINDIDPWNIYKSGFN